MKYDTKYYDARTHVVGRIWMLGALAMMFGVPAAICVHFDAWPGAAPVLRGLLGVVPVFWTVAAIEVLTFTPMLGTGGTYLGFVTGNLVNLKVPAALSAIENAGAEPGSPQAEVLSTIAIAVSSIVTTLVIAVGVLALAPLTPILNSELLKPAFDNILPALFGGLAVVYVNKNWKIALAPMLVMIALFVSFPSLSRAVSLLVPVGAAISLVAARILYKKGLI